MAMRIRVIFKKYLKEWANDLRERSETEKQTARGRDLVKQYKQCKDLPESIIGDEAGFPGIQAIVKALRGQHEQQTISDTVELIRELFSQMKRIALMHHNYEKT